MVFNPLPELKSINIAGQHLARCCGIVMINFANSEKSLQFMNDIQTDFEIIDYNELKQNLLLKATHKTSMDMVLAEHIRNYLQTCLSDGKDILLLNLFNTTRSDQSYDITIPYHVQYMCSEIFNARYSKDIGKLEVKNIKSRAGKEGYVAFFDDLLWKFNKLFPETV